MILSDPHILTFAIEDISVNKETIEKKMNHASKMTSLCSLGMMLKVLERIPFWCVLQTTCAPL